MKHLIFILSFFCFSVSYTQVFTLKLSNYERIKKSFSEEIEAFESLEFNINGIKFKVSELDSIQIPINAVGFDTLKYNYTIKNKKKNESTIARFKANQEYILYPCTCCGIFLINTKNAERGIVRFNNKSNLKLVGNTGELDQEILKPKTLSQYFFSSISMNCGYRPNELSIYTSDFKINSEYNMFDLKEQKFSVNFLFMEGEKLTIEYNKKGKAKIIFDGYLEKGEVEKFYKIYEEN